MAGELRHEDTATGTTLKRSDWEDVDIHRFDSQAIGDMPYASSATQLSRRAIGATGEILTVIGGVPSWEDEISLGDDKFLQFGGAASLGWETADPNANVLLLALPEEDGTDVSVFVIGDVTALDKDLGLFDAQTRPLIAVLSDDATGYMGLQSLGIEASAATFRIDLAAQAVFRFKLNITNNVPTLYGEGAYLRIGDAFQTSHVLNTEDDLMVSGKLEVDGDAYFDTDLAFATSIDSVLVANEVSLGGYDIAPGERSLAISQENPVVVEAIGASDRTLPVRINGTDYKILLHT